MWGVRVYCPRPQAHEVALEVGKKEKRERERKRERAGGLPPVSGDFWGGGAGESSEGPQPSKRSSAGRLCLLEEECPRGHGSSAGVRGREEEEERWQGRQRLHTRLYPVEISRALKSSESMLPVCFCSQDAGIAEEARPRGGKKGRPMCTAGRQDSGGSGETGGQRDQVRGKVSERHEGREVAREP